MVIEWILAPCLYQRVLCVDFKVNYGAPMNLEEPKVTLGELLLPEQIGSKYKEEDGQD